MFRLDRVLSSARLLQLRLRLHRGDAGRRRRPHRRPPDHRRADVHRLSRLGATGRRARDARREGVRLQGPVRRARRRPPGAHRGPRPDAPASARRDRAVLRDLQGARGQDGRRSSAGATGTGRSTCFAPTATAWQPRQAPHAGDRALEAAALAGRRPAGAARLHRGAAARTARRRGRRRWSIGCAPPVCRAAVATFAGSASMACT